MNFVRSLISELSSPWCSDFPSNLCRAGPPGLLFPSPENELLDFFWVAWVIWRASTRSLWSSKTAVRGSELLLWGACPVRKSQLLKIRDSPVAANQKEEKKIVFWVGLPLRIFRNSKDASPSCHRDFRWGNRTEQEYTERNADLTDSIHTGCFKEQLTSIRRSICHPTK